MEIYYVYILLCSDKSYYTGITNNLDKRLTEHQSSRYFNSYTSRRLPVELVWCSKFTDVNLAIQKEKQIKGWSRRKKRALIEEDFEALVSFSKNYTEFGKGVR